MMHIRTQTEREKLIEKRKNKQYKGTKPTKQQVPPAKTKGNIA